MESRNSYIFLKNPFFKEEDEQHEENGTIVLVIGKNLYNYIKSTFPAITKVEGYGNIYKKKYVTTLQYNESSFEVEFIITEVVDNKYLDIVVTGKTKAQTVKCLEHIQDTLLSSGVRERFIDIISYDAVSEYYCNKIYPKLNVLERNLRQLLFNIYIVNFGRDYYKATIGEELQGKIKGVIKSDRRNEEKERIKADYKAVTNKDIDEIARLQRFFYSFEYTDIQKLLFTPSWTSADEIEKTKFLEKHADLSVLSNEELRNAFSKYVPKSDWERFFSSKIDIYDIQDLIEQLRQYRNDVAHFKFFYKADYDLCNNLIKRLNTTIIKAIKITEDIDFARKNAETLSKTLEKLTDVFIAFKESFAEIVQNTHKVFTKAIVPAVKAIADCIKDSPLSKPLEADASETAERSSDPEYDG